MALFYWQIAKLALFYGVDVSADWGIMLFYRIKKDIVMHKKFVRAIFPGSFDPITNGHMDVIHRGINLFDELIVAVGQSPAKDPLFTQQERVNMIAELVSEMPRVRVESFEGLMVEYALKNNIDVILRGMRSLTDVQYEFRLAMTNRAVAGLETVFIMTSAEYGFTSSTLIREVVGLGGNVTNLIPEPIYEKLKKRISERKQQKGKIQEISDDNIIGV